MYTSQAGALAIYRHALAGPLSREVCEGANLVGVLMPTFCCFFNSFKMKILFFCLWPVAFIVFPSFSGGYDTTSTPRFSF